MAVNSPFTKTLFVGRPPLPLWSRLSDTTPWTEAHSVPLSSRHPDKNTGVGCYFLLLPFSFNIYIYLFVWLCWVLVAACRVFGWGMQDFFFFFGCGIQDLVSKRSWAQPASKALSCSPAQQSFPCPCLSSIPSLPGLVREYSPHLCAPLSSQDSEQDRRKTNQTKVLFPCEKWITDKQLPPLRRKNLQTESNLPNVPWVIEPRN